jgi:hypothetical protein
MGFPKCHVLRCDGEISCLVVVTTAGEWEKIDRFTIPTTVETSDDYNEDAKGIYDTAQSAVGFLTWSSQSTADWKFESFEDLSDKDIRILRKEAFWPR